MHKANKPEWHVVEEPNIGLIRDGVLNSYYADRFEFRSNNGARGYGVCIARQEEDVYRLSASGAWEIAWIGWKIDFDKTDYIDLNWQIVSGRNWIRFRISDTAYNTSVASWNTAEYDYHKVYSENIHANKYTINVSKYSGTHWIYIYTHYRGDTIYHLLDIELRKAE